MYVVSQIAPANRAACVFVPPLVLLFCPKGSAFMRTKGPKKLLAVAAVLLLTPLFLFAERPHNKKGCDTSFRADKHCQQVPEGGSNGGYFIAIGLTCLGAMLVRSRFRTVSS